MQSKTKRVALLGTALATAATLGGVGILTSANAVQAPASATAAAVDATKVRGELNTVNNSGATGKAVVKMDGRKAHVEIKAHGLAPNLPHAQHIHYGAQARNECPSVADDANGDHRLNVVEGVPAYGPVRVSLTTNGDTSAASALAVDRFPTASQGNIDYQRTTKVGKSVAQAIRDGEGVVVVHGVDYNDNGKYDFDGAGKSDLDKALPAEATDPAVCGVLTK